MNKPALRWLLGLALIGAAGVALTLRERFDAVALQAWVEGAGALFGPFSGTLWNLSSATVGAAFAFLIARTIGADWVARRAGPRLQRLNDGVAAEGWRFVAFVRLVPLFPFNLLNYALGLTRTSFVSYVLASWVFMLPAAFAYTWLGHAGREASTGGQGLIRKLGIAAALLAAVACLPRIRPRRRVCSPRPASPTPGSSATSWSARSSTRLCWRPPWSCVSRAGT